MGALLVDGLPSLFWDKSSESRGQLQEGPVSRQTDGIRVLFETYDIRDGRKFSQTAILSSATTVQQIKLSGRTQGWFRSGDKLVLGGRELLGHECLGQLPREKNTDHLHVYVKLSDLNSFSILSTAGKTYSYNRPVSPKKSALTASLARSKSAQPPPVSESLVVRGQVLDADTPLSRAASCTSTDAVVHLVIRRPKVECQIHKDSFELVITSSDNVESIKKKVEAQHGLLADSHSLVWQGQRLSASKSLASYGVGTGSVLELVPITPAEPANLPSGSPMLSSPEHELYEDWLKARAGLAAGQTPKLASSGTGGSYFIADTRGKNVAVFKPEDEEPMAKNNPKGHSGEGTEGYRRGVAPGEGAIREVAAFLLDHDHFAGVPPTALVSCQETTKANASSMTSEAKVGSLQAYVPSEGDCEERGTSSFPVEEVHKIAILDIRLANCDRNGGNILAKRCEESNACSWRLIPIDHGYCLPSTLADVTFEWMWWPQAEKPFSERSKEYINALDSERDELTLKAHGISLRPECNRIRKACTMLLKKAVAKDYTPACIAGLMCRDNSQKSILERVHAHALQMSKAKSSRDDVDDAVYLKHVANALDEVLED